MTSSRGVLWWATGTEGLGPRLCGVECRNGLEGSGQPVMCVFLGCFYELDERLLSTYTRFHTCILFLCSSQAGLEPFTSRAFHPGGPGLAEVKLTVE